MDRKCHEEQKAVSKIYKTLEKRTTMAKESNSTYSCISQEYLTLLYQAWIFFFFYIFNCIMLVTLRLVTFSSYWIYSFSSSKSMSEVDYVLLCPACQRTNLPKLLENKWMHFVIARLSVQLRVCMVGCISDGQEEEYRALVDEFVDWSASECE